MAEATAKPTRGFWIIAIIALVWNALGILTYLMDVTMSEAALAKLSEAERALREEMPALVTGAYALSVFVGTLASVMLLLRKSWAVPLFVFSLVAILVQMGYALFMSGALEVRGAAAAVLPIVIILVAAFLAWYSNSARQKGWLS